MNEPETSRESRHLVPPEESEQPQTDITSMVQSVALGQHRSDAHRARDQYRHPAETLAFFGLRPEMRVVELMPGEGWYTELLAPMLVARGKLTAVEVVFGPYDVPEDQDEGSLQLELRKTANAWDENFPKLNAVFSTVDTRAVLPDELDLGAPGSADMVLTFRNMHSFAIRDYEEQLLDAAFKVLRPGGVLGVVQHRASTDMGDARAQAYQTGYLPEQYVIDKIESFGFQLQAKSEINANPSDTKDYPMGVWTLPPRLAMGEQDRDRYASIGESDRMTLRFIKPLM